MNILWGYLARHPQTMSLFKETAHSERVVNRLGVVTEYPSALVVDFARPLTTYTEAEGRYTCWCLGYTSSEGSIMEEPQLLLEGWLRQGRSYFSKCHGSYAIVIYDALQETFHVITDHYGTRTLFYTSTEYGVGFGSRPEQVRLTPGFEPPINERAVMEYLLTGFVLGDHTFYEHLNMIPPATEAVFSKKGAEFFQYVPESARTVAENISLEQAAQIFLETLSQQLALQIKKYQPRFANLTGGTDSRLILSALSEPTRKKLCFVTQQGAWTSATGDHDSQIARIIAERYALQHEVKLPKEKKEAFVAPFSRFSNQVLLVNEPKICGGFGSELVSGSLYHEVWFLDDNKDVDFSRLSFLAREFSGQKQQLALDVVEQIKSSMNNNHAADPVYALFISRCWRSYFTCIYNYADFSWISPYNRLQGTGIYPFLNTAMLGILHQFPRAILKNYALYGYLYAQDLKEYGLFPFKSTFTKLVKGFSQLPATATNPHKEVPAPPQDVFDKNSEKLRAMNFFDSEVPSTLSQDEHWKRRLLELSL